MQNLRPLKDQVLVRQDPSTDKVGKEGLLYAPQGSEQFPNYGTVIAAGPGIPNKDGIYVPLEVKAGDRVLFKRKVGSAINPDPREGDPDGMKNYLMLREGDILAVVEA
jgi:chaperonin GroES